MIFWGEAFVAKVDVNGTAPPQQPPATPPAAPALVSPADAAVVSQLTLGGLPTTRMWWRVRANDGGAWSAARRFEVKR